jgi:hypothetical protein
LEADWVLRSIGPLLGELLEELQELSPHVATRRDAGHRTKHKVKVCPSGYHKSGNNCVRVTSGQRRKQAIKKKKYRRSGAGRKTAKRSAKWKKMYHWAEVPEMTNLVEKVDEKLINRARAVLGMGVDEREAVQILRKSGVSQQDAYLAVKAAKLMDKEESSAPCLGCLIEELRVLCELTALDYASQYMSFKKNLERAKSTKDEKEIRYWDRMLRRLQLKARRALPPGERARAEKLKPGQLYAKLAAAQREE